MSLLLPGKKKEPITNLPGDRERFRVGTLQYTKAALIILFMWLLWGDFCFSLMELVMPITLKLKLKSLGAPNIAMSLIVTTIPSSMNFMINPIVSFRSDRFRSRWGRRIPFLLFATPFVVVFLILLGFSADIGRYLHSAALGGWNLSATTSIIVVMGVLMVCFEFFNMFIASVYYYLFNDVVPPAFLTRFMALFRVVGFLAGWLFNFFLFGYAVEYIKPIFIVAGLLYGTAFLLMCWRVKEGEYPPPPPNVGQRKGVLAAAQTYFRECFTHRFYLCYFLFTGLWTLGGACIQFQVFFAQSLGMTLGQFGKLQSFLMIPSMVLLYPAAALADRLHPLRMLLIAGCTLPVLYFLVFILAHSIPAYVVIMALVVPINAFYGACIGPVSMLLWPKDRYGQFGSANAMFSSSFNIFGSLAAGLLLDFLASHLGGRHDDYYRYIFLWVSVFQTLAMVFLWQVYRGWQRHGGRKAYVPPTVNAKV